VLGLSALGVRAAALTSLTDKEEVAAITRQVDEEAGAAAGGGGGLRLLYCTPEKIVSSKRFFAKARVVRLGGWGRGSAGR
jgi:ATP-dependent DNA helicase Q1